MTNAEPGTGRSPYAARKHDHHNPLAGGKLVPSKGLAAAGTASSGTFLRGDDTWAAIPTAPTVAGPATAAIQSVPFSYAGALAVATSTPWVAHDGGSLFEARALLGTAGTTNTVATVYVNGVSIGTITLGSGVTTLDTSLSAALHAETDTVTVGVTTVGTGAKDLTVLVRVA